MTTLQDVHPIRRFLITSKLAAIQLLWRIKYRLFPAKLPKNTDGKIFLNLGCGDKTSTEFTNIDAVAFRDTHFVQNISDLSNFPSNSVDMVYASHVIEHLPRTSLVSTLREWHRVLKPGGILRFGVPDFDVLIRMYIASNRNVESIVAQLLGQDTQYDDHHTIWNKEYAQKVFTEAGFSSVREWDVVTADHHTFKDKTNRMFMIDGVPVSFSLNLEAVK